MAGYIPRADTDFNAWIAGLAAYANAHQAELNVSPGELDALNDSLAAWQAAFPASIAAQAAAAAAVEKKNSDRARAEAEARRFAAAMQARPGVTDAMRAAMGITVRDKIRTAPAAPLTSPIATVDTSKRLRHMIDFRDSATPTQKARPAGCHGCEIWMKVGDPPADPRELKYLATDTNTPYLVEFEGVDAGKTAHYMLRWVNTRGVRGPWSETVSATITG
jgi:hypothetical protein